MKPKGNRAQFILVLKVVFSSLLSCYVTLLIRTIDAVAKLFAEQILKDSEQLANTVRKEITFAGKWAPSVGGRCVYSHDISYTKHKTKHTIRHMILIFHTVLTNTLAYLW